MKDASDQFKQRIIDEGLNPPLDIISDGSLHRFSSDGRKGDDAGWYVFYPDGVEAGAFGCWRAGIKVKWFSKSELKLTKQEKALISSRLDQAEKERQEIEGKNHLEAQQKAKESWNKASQAPSEHPYLKDKKIKAHNAKVSNGSLVIPLYDSDKNMTSLQFIRDEGEKRFLKGGKTKGCYYPLGKAPRESLYIAEGFATAATIQELTSKAVTVAFNAGNLDSVCASLRRKFPLIKIVVCADDDFETKGNPGISRAIEAAKRHQAKVVFPRFSSAREKGDTDFNDLYRKEGSGQTLECLKNELNPEELELKVAQMRVEEAISRMKEGDPNAHLDELVLSSWRVLKEKDNKSFQVKRNEVSKSKAVNIAELDEKLQCRERDESSEDITKSITDIGIQLCELFRDSSGDAYASFIKKGHREHWRVDSEGFRIWISYQYMKKTGRAPSEHALKQALLTLSGKAQIEGREEEVNLRVAFDGESYWIDLSDQDWRAIKVNSRGWEVVDDPPVVFVRTQSMRPLPEPSKEGDITPLWSIVNIPEESRLLALAWMIESFRPNTPYPLLELTGEQGSAKSKTQDNLRSLIDPNQVNLRSNPNKTESLFIQARNSHLLSYENLSGIKPELQDALCILATGGGSAVRRLYTDQEESIIEAKRPVILNGIDSLVTAQDLLDRTIHIELPRIRERKTEEELKDELDQSISTIFSGLLYLMTQVLELLPNIEIPAHELPRMADFSRLGEAVYQAMGKEEGSFLRDYKDNLSKAIRRAIEASPAIASVIKHVEGLEDQIFEGTFGMLYQELEEYKYSDQPWPKSPKGLGSLLKRYAPSMRHLGFEVEFDQKRSKDGYHVMIKKKAGPNSESEAVPLEIEDEIPF